jgi:hypothetical protein
MTYTIILFVGREPSLTFDEFKNHYEHTHIPLAYSLLSDVWPTTFHRRYFARVHRKGFGGPANPDRPPLTLRGDMHEMDCDCVAELSFPSEKDFRKFYKKLYEKEIAAVLAEDENKFLEQGKVRVIVVGETWSTTPDGVTTSDKSDITKSDVSDSELSSSDQS